jgi:hypothetical protein
MNVEEIIAQVHRCGADLTVIDGRLKAAPPGVLPPELKAAIRERAAEIKALLNAGDGRHEPPRKETAMLPLLLAVIADAIVRAPRSPFLDDLAIARAARCFVEAERTIRDAPETLRAEATSVAADAMNGVADAIRQARYQTAYELLDSLTTRMGGLRVH